MTDVYVPPWWSGGISTVGANGYTPAANQAIANNNANFTANQAAAQQVGQYDPFAQSGGFGRDTANYAAAGAAALGAVGPAQDPGYYSPGSGRSSYSGTPLSGSGGNPYAYNDAAGLTPSTAPNGGTSYAPATTSGTDYRYSDPGYGPAPAGVADWWWAQNGGQTGDTYRGLPGAAASNKLLGYNPDDSLTWTSAAPSYSTTQQNAKPATTPFNTYDQPGVGGYDDPISWRGLSDQQQNYIQQHKSAYGYTPEAGFFDPGGGWDKYYGSKGSTSPAASPGNNFDDRFNSSFPAMNRADLTPDQQRYSQQYADRYGSTPGAGFFDPGGEWDKMYGSKGSSAQASNDTNYMLNALQQRYADQHVARYGYAPENSYFAEGGGYDRDYGRATDMSAQSRMPVWQRSIPADISNDVSEAMNNMAFINLDKNALGTLFDVESKFNKKNATKGNYGIAQMNANEFNYGGAGGKLGGLTFEQYKNASEADQIYAYADLLARIQQRNPTLDFSSMTPQRQYAVLQALNFGPYTGEPGTIQWIKAMNEGNINMPTTDAPQAKELGDRSIAALEQAYLARQGR